MCGRYSLTASVEEMRRLLGFAGPLPNLPPRYNIAPTQAVPVVRLDADGERELAQVRWGLVPAWTKSTGSKDLEIGARLINARGESVAEKAAFRVGFHKRRCLVPADGFYEWQAGAPDKTAAKAPYRIGLKSGGIEGGAPAALPLFAFAGLWERWDRALDRKPVESCAIITTVANELLRPIHGRMPVILAPEDYARWLDPATSPALAQALLKPYPSDAMLAYPVSTRVNSVRNDDAGCIEPAAPGAAPAAAGPPAKTKRAPKPKQPSLF